MARSQSHQFALRAFASCLSIVPLQLRVLGAFFPELLREVIEEEMTEHGLIVVDLPEAERKAKPTRDQEIIEV
jgi:hypothetical protein